MATTSAILRRVPALSPFPGPLRLDEAAPWQAVPQWPARWLEPPASCTPPWVGEFRLVFNLPHAARLRFAATADERYELWLDGALGDRGPDRGDAVRWYYTGYEADLAAGRHELRFRVWALGGMAPSAQISLRPGLLVAGYEDEAHRMLSTGVAAWEWRRLPCWRFTRAGTTGPGEHLDFRSWPEAHSGWEAPVMGRNGNNGFELYPGRHSHLLAPTLLPAQRVTQVRGMRVRSCGRGAAGDPWPVQAADDCEIGRWQALVEGRAALTLPAGSLGRVLLDLGTYVCGRLKLGWRRGTGAELVSLWSEAAQFGPRQADAAAHGSKADRAAWAGGWFGGPEDSWTGDGQPREGQTLWWRAGRFLVLAWRVEEEPLELELLGVEACGADLDPPEIRTGDADWDRLAAVCVRTLEVCAHETTMDCPHYEQLAYAGDSRIQLLCWQALCPADAGLALHTLRHFHASTLNPGMWTASSAPSRGCQAIPPFALWWIAIGADYVRHTGDIGSLRPMLPAMRAMVERWLGDVDGPTGLCRSPEGWNFADSAFPGGVPAGGMPGGVSGVLNWIVLHGIEALAALEAAAGEPLLEQRLRAHATRLAAAVVEATWDAARGMLRDAPGVDAYSEHTQALALGVECLPARTRAALREWLHSSGPDAPDVRRCQAFMAYYLFQACRRAEAWPLLGRRLAPWWECLDLNFSTTPETFGSTRSDAHAWGAHPVLLALEMMQGRLDPRRLAPRWNQG